MPKTSKLEKTRILRWNPNSSKKSFYWLSRSILFNSVTLMVETNAKRFHSHPKIQNNVATNNQNLTVKEKSAQMYPFVSLASHICRASNISKLTFECSRYHRYRLSLEWSENFNEITKIFWLPYRSNFFRKGPNKNERMLIL